MNLRGNLPNPVPDFQNELFSRNLRIQMALRDLSISLANSGLLAGVFLQSLQNGPHKCRPREENFRVSPSMPLREVYGIPGDAPEKVILVILGHAPREAAFGIPRDAP